MVIGVALKRNKNVTKSFERIIMIFEQDLQKRDQHSLLLIMIMLFIVPYNICLFTIDRVYCEYNI